MGQFVFNNKIIMEKIILLDTFAWVGGFHLALEQSIWEENVECIWFSEIDKFATQVYKERFPDIPELGSITELDIDNLPDFDLLTWWFPCQDVSVAWKQSLEWWRTVLVEYLLQILEKKQPKYFVFENVKGLMSKKFDTFRESIFERIKKAWYDMEFQVLNTKNFWLPQNRERVFIVGSLNWVENWELRQWLYDFLMQWWFPQSQKLTTFLKDILEEEVDEKYYLSDEKIEKIKNSTFIQEKTRIQWEELCQTLLARDYKDPKCVNFYNKRIINDICWTLSTSAWFTAKQGFTVFPQARKLTPTEYARLQGFPDNWSTDFVSNSQAYKQMWNAISVPVVKAIFDNLI